MYPYVQLIPLTNKFLIAIKTRSKAAACPVCVTRPIFICFNSASNKLNRMELTYIQYVIQR